MDRIKTISFLLILFSIASALAQTPPILSYKLSLEPPVIHVALTYRPVEPDSTQFIYGEPNFGGQPDIFDAIQAIAVSPGSSVSINSKKRSIVVRFSGQEPITIHYDIVDTYKASRGLRGELFRPMVQPDYLYVHGINLFLDPKFRSFSGDISQEVGWSAPPPLPVFQSFDPDNRGTGVTRGTAESLQMTLLTGSKDLIVDKTILNGIPNYIVLRTHKNPEFNPAVRDFFTKFNEGARKFWNDYSDPYYSLVLQPFQHSDHRISGIAMRNGFLGKFHGDSVLQQDQLQVIAHEVSHHWTGLKLTMSTTHQWFDEGFTDYLCLYNMVSAGLTTPVQFEKEINRIMKSLYNSPVNNTPNEKVFENYWKMDDYNKLPYWRGSLFALYLDNQIVIRSKGKKGIRDLMLALFKFINTQKPGTELTPEKFIEIASGFLPVDMVKRDMDNYIMRGSLIPFSQGMMAGYYKVRSIGMTPTIKVVDTKKFQAHFNIK